MDRRWIIITYLLIAISAAITAGCLKTQGKSEADKILVEGRNLTHPETITVKNTLEPISFSFNGRLRAKHRIELYPEVSGRLLSPDRPFEAGTYFQKGDLLVRIDDTELNLQIISSRSAFRNLVSSIMPDLILDYPEAVEELEEYLKSINPEESLPDLPEIGEGQLRYFLSSRNLFDRYYQIRSAENQLQKFEITAPFNGLLISANVHEGYRISPQSHLGTFISEDSFELTTTLKPNVASKLSVGEVIPLTDRFERGEWKGKVVRKNAAISQNTQGTQVFIEVSGEGLIEGLYLEGSLTGQESAESAWIPRSALLRTGHVYSLKEGVIRMKPVEVTALKGSMVLVSGLKDGVEIIIEHDRPLAGQLYNDMIQGEP